MLALIVGESTMRRLQLRMSYGSERFGMFSQKCSCIQLTNSSMCMQGSLSCWIGGSVLDLADHAQFRCVVVLLVDLRQSRD